MKNQLADVIDNYSETINNTVYIDEQGETLIKQTFARTSDNQVSDNHSKLSDNQVSDNQVIAKLSEQLSVKDEQISQLMGELLKEREHSRQQSDKLTSLAEQMLELTSNSQKLQLADKVMTKNISHEDAPDEAGNNNANTKGFFYRFFGTKDK